MNNYPLVSVIIPTYNREDTIERSINSVLRQTYSNLEVIVVDDCSTDSTEKIVLSIKDGRVKYYKLTQNSKACFARNYGFEHSKGELIALHDSDDVWYKEKLEKQITHLLSNDYDLVFCNINHFHQDGRAVKFPNSKVVIDDNFVYNEIADNVISSITILMKRDVFSCVRFDTKLKRFQDWDCAIRIVERFKVGYLNETLADAFLQDNSISNSEPYYDSLLILYEKHNNKLIENKCAFSRAQAKLGDAVRKTNPHLAKKHYKTAIRHKWSLRLQLKYILSFFGIKF